MFEGLAAVGRATRYPQYVAIDGAAAVEERER
jgi:hypothetical protein